MKQPSGLNGSSISQRGKAVSVAVAVLSLVVCETIRKRVVPRAPEDSVRADEFRGEPIVSSAESNTTTNPELAPAKKRPKPDSFQHRLVEEQLNVADSNAAQGFSGTPAQVVFSRAQLAALPDGPIPSGYERIGFDRLADFNFDLTRAIVDGSTNLAPPLTEARIPESIRALDQKPVAIRGFLIPLKMREGLAIEFLLMRDQNLCCFGTVPRINEWISVKTTQGVKPDMDRPLTVMGRLQVSEIRENGFLVGIYKTDADKILGPDDR